MLLLTIIIVTLYDICLFIYTNIVVRIITNSFVVLLITWCKGLVIYIYIWCNSKLWCCCNCCYSICGGGICVTNVLCKFIDTIVDDTRIELRSTCQLLISLVCIKHCVSCIVVFVCNNTCIIFCLLILYITSSLLFVFTPIIAFLIKSCMCWQCLSNQMLQLRNVVRQWLL